MSAVSKKVVVAADGTVSATDATLVDVFSTVISTDSAVTGMYGLFQRAGLFVGGMALQNYRRQGSWNPL